MDLPKLKKTLQEAGVVFESGLTQEEIQLIEATLHDKNHTRANSGLARE